MPSYGKVAKRGVIWGFLARGMAEVVAIPASMVLARLLTPEDFGIAAAAGFFIQIAQRMTNFGFNTALVQIKELKPEHTSTVFVVNLAVGVTSWAALALTAPWLGKLFDSDDVTRVLPITALTFAIGAIGSVPLSLMTRALRFREITIIEWCGAWVSALGSVGLAWLGFGYWSLVYSQIASAAVLAGGRLMIARWPPSLRYSRSALRDLLSFGIGIHAKRLLDSGAQNVDNLVVGNTLGLVALGFYDKAFNMMNRALVLLGSAGPAVSFRILAIISDDAERFRLAYRKILVTSSFLAYPAFAALIAVAPELFLVMFGEEWAASVAPFRVLCVAGALKFLNGYASTATQAKGMVWGEVWRQIGYTTLIVVGVMVGSRAGLIGAAIGVLAATGVMTVLMQDFLSRTTSVTWRDVWAAQLPGIVCAVGLWATLEGLSLLANGSVLPIVYLVIALAVCALYSVLFLYLTRFRELNAALRESVAELAPGFVRLLPKAIPDRS